MQAGVDLPLDVLLSGARPRRHADPDSAPGAGPDSATVGPHAAPHPSPPRRVESEQEAHIPDLSRGRALDPDEEEEEARRPPAHRAARRNTAERAVGDGLRARPPGGWV